MKIERPQISIAFDFMKIAAFLSVAYLTTFYSYILFHSLVEVFYVLVALIIFAIVWNSRKFIDNNFFILLGIAFLFIGLIDLIHLFTYKGVFLYNSDSFNLSTQLWLAARYLTSFSLVAALLFVKRKIYPYLTFVIFFVITSFVFASIFYWQIFPVAFDQDGNPTNFKIYSELIILIFSVISIIMLLKNRSNFDNRVKNLLLLSIITGAGSEIGIISSLPTLDLVGHFLKVFSFSFLYLGIVETIIIRPFRILFKNLKDSEVALRESEERYRSLVELSPSAIFLHVDNKIVYANPVSYQLFGANNESEVIGKNILDFFPPNHQSKIIKRIDNLKEGAVKQSVIETKIININGSMIEVEASGSLINFGGKIAVQSVLRDITQRKADEKSFKAHTKEVEKIADDLKKFKLAVENASDAICITDLSFKIIYANSAAEKITGYKGNEILGRTPMLWRDHDAKDQESKIDSFINKVTEVMRDSGNLFHCEVVNRSKQGRRYTSSLNISQVKDDSNKAIFFVLIERDITKEKEIDLAKTEFVSLASHQLRTPLASIGLSAELLLRGVSGQVDASSKRYLDEIFNSTVRMKDLIESLLNISRIELGTFVVKFESLDFKKEINEIIKEFDLKIKSKKIKLRKKIDKSLPIVKFDKNILEIIIENLLTNAIRYTQNGGNICVELKRGDKEILMIVSDNGHGIPSDQQDKIFDKMFRADNAREFSYEGDGLGLYMVKSVVSKIGGKIWVESELNKGSSFFVSLPLREKNAVYCIEK